MLYRRGRRTGYGSGSLFATVHSTVRPVKCHLWLGVTFVLFALSRILCTQAVVPPPLWFPIFFAGAQVIVSRNGLTIQSTQYYTSKLNWGSSEGRSVEKDGSRCCPKAILNRSEMDQVLISEYFAYKSFKLKDFAGVFAQLDDSTRSRLKFFQPRLLCCHNSKHARSEERRVGKECRSRW